MDTSSFDRLARQIPLYRDILLQVPETVKEQAFDIHFKSGQPVSICGKEGIFFLKEGGGVTRALVDGLAVTSREELQELFLQTCAHSVFSHEHEIKKGYVLVGSTYRAGVCGTAVLENGTVKSVRDISSIAFRIPREAQGCADRLFLEGVDLRRGVLVAGEPSSGKTTFLRDIARSLSVGKFQPSRRVTVLDERGEIGGAFSLGPCADVLCGYPKAEAFDIAIRMLSPEFILCDELSDRELDTVRGSVFAGVSLIASVHAGRRDLLQRPLCRELLKSGAFHTVVCLNGRSQPGEIETIEMVGDVDETVGSGAGDIERPVPGTQPGTGAAKKGMVVA